MVRSAHEISRFETGLASVSGAVWEIVIRLNTETTRKSSHIPNPGGTRSLRLPLARHRYIRLAMGMANSTGAYSPKPSSHHSGHSTSITVSGQAGSLANQRPSRRGLRSGDSWG